MIDLSKKMTRKGGKFGMQSFAKFKRAVRSLTVMFSKHSIQKLQNKEDKQHMWKLFK